MSTSFVADFIKRNQLAIFKQELSDRKYQLFGKFFVVIFGLLCIGFSYICDSLGQMLQGIGL